jgi:hypothetical protein
MFRLWQVLFATSRLTGRVPMPWMEHGTGCWHLDHSNLHPVVRSHVGWTDTLDRSRDVPQCHPCANVLFRVLFDFIMDRALWRRPPAGFLAPRLV